MLEHIEMTKLSVIIDMIDRKMSPPTAFMMNRGTKICVAAAMLAPKTSIVNNCQNSLRDELNRFDNFESWSCLWQSFLNSGLIMESSLKKLMIKAVICTIISAKIIRHQTIRASKLKAVMVEIMVIGFKIGAAKRKLITSAGFSPFAYIFCY
jgi:hypothetical protein